MTQLLRERKVAVLNISRLVARGPLAACKLLHAVGLPRQFAAAVVAAAAAWRLLISFERRFFFCIRARGTAAVDRRTTRRRCGTVFEDGIFGRLSGFGFHTTQRAAKHCRSADSGTFRNEKR